MGIEENAFFVKCIPSVEYRAQIKWSGWQLAQPKPKLCHARWTQAQAQTRPEHKPESVPNCKFRFRLLPDIFGFSLFFKGLKFRKCMYYAYVYSLSSIQISEFRPEHDLILNRPSQFSFWLVWYPRSGLAQPKFHPYLQFVQN